MKIISDLLGGFVDLLFPPRRVCPLCGQFQENSKICDVCLDKFRELRHEPVCSICGRFFHDSAEMAEGVSLDFADGVFCRDCLNDGRYFYMSRAAGPYDGDLKRAVRRLKYHGRRELADHLAALMFDRIAGNGHYSRVEIIVAVPLSQGRLRQRGYNQAELLAHGLSARMMAPVLPVLQKNRDTPPQTSLNRSSRRENLRGAFTLAGASPVKGKTVLLVDDVVTTCTTLNTAAETLVQGGAGLVLCIAAAAGRIHSAAAFE